MAERPLILGSDGTTRDVVVAVARQRRRIELGADARAAIDSAAALVEAAAAATDPVYGVSTGFGSLANTAIPVARRAELQKALIRSHAAGLGDRVADEVVRAMMLLRARTLAMGYSGVRPIVVDTLLAMVAADVVPPVYEHGSLGASGDLAPLAHVALALIGEGDDETRAVMNAAGIAPVELGPKEGLALINGTDGMLGMLVLAIDDLWRVLRAADVAAAMSVEALLGTDRAFSAELMALRPHPGQTASAANLRRLLSGSAIVASHRTGDSRVQDAYSLRCAPQVHGACRDAVAHGERVADIELGAAIDNPTVLPDGRIESCGHFHGAPVAHALDFLAIGVADVGAICERRTDRLLDQKRSQGLPPFLVDDAGVNSGLMIVHYTQAAMVAENRRLAVPASADTIPTSAMQEDHVSLGWAAATKLRTAIVNLERIVASELLCAARALELRAPLEPAAATSAAIAALRAAGVGGPGPDRWQAPEQRAAVAAVHDGSIVAAVEAVTGPLE